MCVENVICFHEKCVSSHAVKVESPSHVLCFFDNLLPNIMNQLRACFVCKININDMTEENFKYLALTLNILCSSLVNIIGQ